MAFWGTEVRSGKPITLSSSSDKGRFHLTQATLGLSAYDEDESKGSFVQCNVGDKPGVLICSLFPGKINMCSFNLQFDEDEEVVFSVLGPSSVHLCGFFEERNPDEYGEDITKENSEDEEEEDEDMSDDDDGFIVADDDSEEDDMIVSPGVVPNYGVKIEEIVDDVEAEKEGTQKAKKRDKKKKKKEEDKKDDQEEQKTMSPEGNGIEKEEGSGEGNKVSGDNNEVSVNGKRKKKSKGNEQGEGEGEAEAEEEPPSKKGATEEAVTAITEAAEVKTFKKKKKSKKAKNKGDAPKE